MVFFASFLFNYVNALSTILRLYCEDYCSAINVNNKQISQALPLPDKQLNTYNSFETSPNDNIRIYVNSRSNSDVKIGGYINIDGFVFYLNITNPLNTIWYSSTITQITTEEITDISKSYILYKSSSIQAEYFVSINIPTSLETNTLYNEYIKQYQCSSHTITIFNYNVTDINLADYISPSLKSPSIIKITYPPSGYRGVLYQTDETNPVQNKLVYTPLHYKPDSSSYETSFDYHVFRDGVDYNCDSSTITILVCEKGCYCQQGISCALCLEGYAKKIGDTSHCYDITSQIQGYYYNSFHNYFALCYQSCKTCSSYQEGDNHNCLTCNSSYSNYLIKGNTKNCYTNCNSAFLYKRGNECYEECPAYYFISSDGTECVLSCSEPFLIEGKQCASTCGTHYRIENTNNCVGNCKNNNNYYLNVDATPKQCTRECNDKKYFSTTENYCVSSCVTVNKYYDTVNDKCVDECPLYAPYIDGNDCVRHCQANSFLYNGECTMSCFGYTHNELCVDECPYTFNANNECVFPLSNQIVDGNYIHSSIPFTSMKENLLVDYIDYEAMGGTVKGANYYLQVYKSSAPISDVNVSELDIEQCEMILREHYSIPDSEDITIIKIDKINENNYINQVMIYVYDDMRNQLDLSLCNETPFMIKYPLNNREGMLYSFAKEMQQKGIDIYNASDTFFNDICDTREINDTNVIMSDRRDIIYQNVSLCDSNCIYNEIDFNSNKSICSCQSNSKFFSSNDISTKNKDKFPNKITPLNLDMLTCIDEIFTWTNLKNNYAFWASSITIFSSVICCVYQIVFDIGFSSQKVFTVIQKFNPPIIFYRTNANNSNINDKTFFDKNKSGVLMKNYFYDCITREHKRQTMPGIFNPDDFSNDRLTTPSKTEAKTKDDIIREFIIYKNDFDNYPYCIAIRYFARTFCAIYSDILKHKNSILCLVFGDFRFDFISLHISLFILHFCLLFTFNALILSSKLISKRFINGRLNIFLFICNSICSCLISHIIIVIINFFFSDPKKLKTLFFEIKNDKKYLEYRIKRRFLIFTIKTVIFTILHLAFIVFFSFYCVSFCTIYPKYQFYWILGSLTSFLLCFIYSIVISLIITLLKYNAIKKRMFYLFNISLFLYRYL